MGSRGIIGWGWVAVLALLLLLGGAKRAGADNEIEIIIREPTEAAGEMGLKLLRLKGRFECKTQHPHTFGAGRRDTCVVGGAYWDAVGMDAIHARLMACISDAYEHYWLTSPRDGSGRVLGEPHFSLVRQRCDMVYQQAKETNR